MWPSLYIPILHCTHLLYQGEMDRLMKETETLQHQARVFKVDADQFAMALQQQQEENRELKTEVSLCRRPR